MLQKRRHRAEKQRTGNRVNRRTLVIFLRFDANILGVLPGKHQR